MTYKQNNDIKTTTITNLEYYNKLYVQLVNIL